MNKLKTRNFVVLALGLGAFGCGGAALPNENLTAAKEAVSAAKAVGAADEPQADLHLKLAQDGILEAEKQISTGKNVEANSSLERAIADAELASELTNEAVKRRAAEVAMTRLQDLKQSASAQEN